MGAELGRGLGFLGYSTALYMSLNYTLDFAGLNAPNDCLVLTKHFCKKISHCQICQNTLKRGPCAQLKRINYVLYTKTYFET